LPAWCRRGYQEQSGRGQSSRYVTSAKERVPEPNERTRLRQAPDNNSRPGSTWAPSAKHRFCALHHFWSERTVASPRDPTLCALGTAATDMPQMPDALTGLAVVEGPATGRSDARSPLRTPAAIETIELTTGT